MEPKGTKFRDLKSGRMMVLVADGEPYAGWLCYRHPDGQWVTLRQATERDRDAVADAFYKAFRATINTK